MASIKRSQSLNKRNPLIASLLGDFRKPIHAAQESTEESMRYPPEILQGFALGALLGVLPVAAIWVFRQSLLNMLIQTASQPGTSGFWLFWIAAGLLTALLVTGAFAAAASLAGREVVLDVREGLQAIPATGEKKEEEDERKE